MLMRPVAALLMLSLSVCGGPGILAGLAFLCFGSLQSLSAANVFLDQNGTLSGTGLSTSGTVAVWNASSPLWVNAGTATTISGTLTAAGSYSFTSSDAVFFTGNGGTLSLGTLLTLGSLNISTTDAITLSAGGGSMQLGASGSFSIGAGGVLNFGASLDGGSFGLTKSGAGTLFLAGTASNLGTLTVGAGSMAVVSGGSVTVQTGTSATNVLRVGNTSGNAIFSIAAGAATTTGYLQLGLANSSVGAVINLGTLGILYAGGNSSGAFDLGNSSGGYGYYRQDTPTPVSTPNLSIGGSTGGSGVLDLVSGTLTVSTYLMFARGTGYQNSQLNVLGGSLNLPNSANTFMFYGGTSQGTEVFNILPGGVVTGGAASVLELNRSSTLGSGTLATGIVNVKQGALLTIGSIRSTQSAGVKILNIDGGTLKATNSNSLYVNNLTGLYVYSNGATLDTGSYSITIPQALLAPTGYGLVSGTIAMPPVGGYIGRPMVLLTSSGTGTGATAIADFNVNTGSISGVIVTNPGSGYALGDVVTASFSGGGGSAGTLTLSGGSLAVNSSGGLTKLGSGSLLLSGTNTYTGPTKVVAGTLGFAGPQSLYGGNAAQWIASNLVVNSGATLRLNAGGSAEFSAVDLGTLLTTASGSFAAGAFVAIDTSNAAGGNLSYGGDIGVGANPGMFSLVKVGSGSLSLSGSGNYSSGVTLASGTLNINQVNALGTVPFTITGGAIDTTAGALTLSGSNPQNWNGSFTFNGSNDLSLGQAAASLGASLTLTTNAKALTIAGLLDGNSLSFTKSGAGSLVFTGTALDFGTFSVAGGTVGVMAGGSLTVLSGTSTTNVLAVGSTVGNGLLTIAPGAVVTTGYLQLGLGGAASVGSVINQGTLKIVGTNPTYSLFQVGYSALGFGYYRHDTASSITLPEIDIAGNGKGHGVVDVMSGSIGATAYLSFGRSSTAAYQNGQLNVFGGSVSMPSTTAFFNSSGLYGYGSINVFSGGYALGNSGTVVDLNRSGTLTSGTLANAMVNLQPGATLSALTVKATQATGLSFLNVDGGTLKATANNTSFVSSLTGFYVYPNGATVDTNGFSVTIPQALLAPTGYGLASGSIAMTPAGGYIGRPLVLLTTSGSGTGASAIADFNVSTGSVGGIIITSPGTGYDPGDSITASFLGGGGAAGPLILSGGSLVSNIRPNMGGLTKTGAGTLTLSASNTYSGTTTVSAGMLQFVKRTGFNNGVVLAANLAVQSGAVLALNVGGSGEFTAADLDVLLAPSSSAFANNATLALDTSNAPADTLYAGTITNLNNGTNALGIQKLGLGSLTLSGNNSYTGGTVLSNGTLNLNSSTALGTGSFTINGGAIDNTSGSAKTLLNTGIQNWNASFAFNGSSDLNLGTAPVTLGTSGVITVSASTLTVGGPISGSYALIKSGNGSLVLNGANPFTGNTYVLGGSLVLGGTMTTTTNGLKIGNGVVQVLPGASLIQSSVSVGSVSGTQGALLIGGGTVAGTPWTNVNPLGVGDLGFGYVEISGGSVAFFQLNISANSVAAPGTGVGLLTGGTLVVSDLIVGRSSTNSAASGALTVTGGSLVHTGGYFSIGFGNNLTGLTITGTSIVNLQGGTIDSGVRIYMGTSSLTTNTPYSGDAYLNLNGGVLRSGTIIFGSLGSQYVNFNGGTLKANSSSTAFLAASGTNSTVTLYQNGATFDSNGFSITIPVNLVAPSGSGFSGGTLTSAGTGYTGAPFLSVSGSGGSGASAYATVNNGTIASVVVTSPGSNYTGPLTLTAAGGGGTGFLYTPALAANAGGGLTKIGAGTVTLSGTNTYSGSTSVGAGMLQFAKRASLYNGGTAQWNIANVVVSSGATLGVNFGGAGEFLPSDIPLLLVGSNTGGFLSGSTFNLDTSNAASGTLYAGDMSDTNGGLNVLGFQKSGPGSLTLSGINTYTGGTTVSGGSLILTGGPNRLSTIGAISVQGGTLDLDGSSQTSSGMLTVGSGVLQNGSFISTGTAFNIQGGSVAAVLSGPAGLIKTTSATAYLSAANSYTGSTLISEGSLQVGVGGVSGSLPPLSAIANNGALLFKRSDTLTQGLDFGSLISGTGSLMQLGSGSLVLTATNTYTGTTTISSGTLMLGNGGTSGLLSTASPVVNNGLLILNHADALEQGTNLASSISGAGGILQLGGSLVLAGTISSTSAGSLMIGNAVARLVSGGSVREGMVQIGTGLGSAGALVINGGSLTVLASSAGNNYAPLSIGDGGFGYLEINGGYLTSTTARMSLAASTGTNVGTGVVYMTNGTVSFPELFFGRTATAGGTVNGVFTVTGGTMNFGPTGFFQVGYQGTGIEVLNMQGGSVDHAYGKLGVANNSTFTGQAYLNFNGGVLKTGSIAVINAVAPVFLNFNGGTLRAGTQGATLISAMAAGGGGVFLNAGGAVLDSNGFDVTVAANLLAPAGNGVTSAMLTTAGSSYTGAPLVQFSGGGGAGASGYATVGGGTLASVVITSAGTGYTSAPTLTLTGGGGQTMTLSTTIGANVSGGLTKMGSGTLTLTGANTYTGETVILDGVLQIGAGGATGSIAGTSGIRNSGTLAFNTSSALTQSNISGTGNLRQLGPGTLTLGGTNAYTGRTTVEAGTLQLTQPSALYAADTARWTASNLSVNPGASLVLNVGGTGFLEADLNSILSMGTAGGGGFAGNALIGFDTTNAAGGTFTYSGAIVDSNGNTLHVSKFGPGIFTLAGTNTFTGVTTVASGTLQLRGGAALVDTGSVNIGTAQLLVSESETVGSVRGITSSTITLAEGATLTVGLPGSAGTLPALITGSGSLSLAGGSLNLSAANNFMGNVSVKAGTLVITNSATFSGTGQLNPRTVTIDPGAILQLNVGMTLTGGSAITTLTGSGSLRLNVPQGSTAFLQKPAFSGGAVIDVQSGALYNSTSPGMDWTTNLGGLNVGPNGNFRNWNGSPVFVDAITGSGLIGGSSQVTYSSANITFGVNNGSGEFSGTISYVTGSLIKTGTGTQVFSGTNSYTGLTKIWNGSLSVSSINSVNTGSMAASNLGAPSNTLGGTVSLGSLSTTGALVYTGTGETTDRVISLAGTTGGGVLDQSGTGLLKFNALSATGSFTATGAGSKTLTLQGSSAGIGEISAVIVNNSSINTTAVLKQGTGAWVLSGTNTYTGGTTINAGSLLLSGGSNRLATTGSINISGGVLDLGGFSQTTSGTITFAGGVAQNGTLISTGTAFNALGGTVSAVLAGSLGLTKTSPATLTLGAANTYTGATLLSAGTLLLAGGTNRLGTAGALTLSGGILDLGGYAQTTSGTITLAGATVQNGVLTSTGTAFAGQSGYVSAVLAGTQGLTKSTAASLTLDAANSYTGNTNVTLGVLSIVNTGSLSSLSSLTVANNAQVNYFPANAGTLGLATGSLNSGSSVGLKFGSTILFSGSVNVGGTVNLVASGSYTSGGTYTFLRAAGGLNAGTYNVTGATDYTFVLGITPTAITLTPTYIGPLTEAYWIGGMAAGPASWAVPNWSTTSGGALQSRNPGPSTNVILDGNGANLGSMILGASVSVGSITTSGSFVSGTLAYTAGQTLSLGSSGAAGVIAVNVGTLTINSDLVLVADSTFNNLASGTLTLGGVISGSSSIVKGGSGSVLFSGANTYTGSTTISEGILHVGTGGTNGALSASGPVLNNGTLVFNRSNTGSQGVDFGSVLAGSGLLTKLAGGTLILTGSNTYSGATNVLAGVLNLRHASALGSSAGNTSVASGAALEMQGDIAITSEDLVLGGSGVANGGALRSVSGNNTFGGSIAMTSASRINVDAGALTLNGPINSSGNALSLGGAGSISIGNSLNLGAGTFTKDGSGSVYVTGTNFGAGAVVLSAGTTQVGMGGTAGALGSGGSITLANNALLILNRSDTVTQGVDFGMVISGSGSLQKSGAGTLILSGTNTYVGSTALAQGTIIVTQTGALSPATSLVFGGGASSTTPVNLDLTTASGTVANLFVQTNTASANQVTIGTGQTLSVTGGSIFSVGVYNNSSNTSTNLAFLGAGSLVVSMPSGTLSVGSAAASSINAGTLDLTALGSFVINASQIRIGSNLKTQGLLLLSNSVNMVSAAKISVGDGEMSGNGTSSPSLITLGRGINNIAADNFLVGGNKGTANVGFSSQTAGSSGSAVLGGKAQAFMNIYVGTLSGNTGFMTAGTLDFRGHNVSLTGGTVWLGVGFHSASTGGALGTLSLDAGSASVNALMVGANTYVGGTFTGTDAGTLNIGGGTLVVNTGGSFVLASNASVSGSVRAFINLTGGSVISNADMTIAGGTNALATITLGGGTLDLTGHSLGSAATAGSLALNVFAGRLQNIGTISGSGGLTKTTPGVLTLAGTNSFVGGVFLNAGTLSLNSADALGAPTSVLTVGSATALNNSSGAAVTLSANNPQIWNGDFAFIGDSALHMGSGSITMGTSTTISVNASTLTLAGAISGAGLSLTKSGNGTLVLAGTTTTATVAVAAGTLVAGSASPFGNATLQVTGGKLDLSAYPVSASSLAMSGGLLNFAYGNLVSFSGQAILGGTLQVSGTAASLTAARYPVASAAGGFSGSFNDGPLPDSLNYHLQANGTSLDLQHRATLSLLPTAVSRSVHTGSVSVGVEVANTAPADSDRLYFALGGSISASGLVVDAGTSTIVSGTYLATPGPNALSVSLFSTGSIATTNGTQTVSFSVTGYTPASAPGAQAIDFGALRTGTQASKPLSLANTAPADASYTESLSSLGFTNTRAGFIAGGSVAGVAGGGSGTGSLFVGFGNALSAGLQSGTTTLLLQSNALPGSGLEDTSLAPQLITITGTLYDYASPVYAGGTVALGNVRTGAPSPSQSVAFANAPVSNAAFQDALDVSASANNTKVSASGFSGLLASAGTGFLVVAGSTAVAGDLRSTLSLSLTSNSRGIAGLNNSTLSAAQPLTTEGGVYDYANPSFVGGTLHFGNVRVNQVLSSQGIAFGNQAITNATYQDSLNVSATSDNPQVSAVGFTALAAGSGSASLVVSGITNAVGSLNATLSLSLVSNANGIAGLQNKSLTAGSSITTTGAVYAYANPGYSADALAFGNVHVGDSRNLVVGNASGLPAFQDALDLSINVPSGISASTNARTVAAGSSASFAFTAAAAGLLSGSVVFDQTSNANGIAGLVNGSLVSKALPVTGAAYNLASAQVAAANLVSFQVGVPKKLTVFNAASPGAYSEDLAVSLVSISNTVVGGSIAHLIAGGSDNASLSITLVSAGTGSFRLELGSTATVNGTPIAGLNPTALDPLTLSITQDAVAYNVASAAATQGVELGNSRTGQRLTVPLRLANTAPVNALFTESLSSTGFVSSSAGIVAGGSVSGIAGGSSGTGSLYVGLGSALPAGVHGGTAVLSLQSNAIWGSGLADTALPPQLVTVSGTLFDYANPVYAAGTLAFGNVRVGSASSTQHVVFSNAVLTNAAYQDSLNASALSDNPRVSVSGFTGLAAGAGTRSLAVSINTGSAGSLASALALSLTSDARGVAGLTNAALTPTGSLTTAGGVFAYAQPAWSAGSVAFGTVHVGTSQTVSVSNVRMAPAGFQDSLDVSGSGTPRVSIASGTSNIVPGESLPFTFSVSSAGPLSGTVSFAQISHANGIPGLTDMALPSVQIPVTGLAYELAAGSASTTGIGAFRVGVAKAIPLTNTAPAGLYSEDLSATLSPISNVTVSGSVNALPAGATDGTHLMVTLSAPGNGTVRLNLQSTGSVQGVPNGLGVTALAPQTLTLSAVGYLTATTNFENTGIDLGAVRQNGVFALKPVSITNTLPVGVYSEDLLASFANAQGVQTQGGSVVVTAGATSSNALSVGLTGSTAVAGSLTGTVQVQFASQEVNQSGLGVTALPDATRTVTVFGRVYRLAVGSLSGGGTVSLKAVREGEAFAPVKVGVANVADLGNNDRFSDDLVAAMGVTSGGVVGSGTSVAIAAGSVDATSLSVGYTASTVSAGTVSGSAVVNYTSRGQAGTGLGDTTPVLSSGTVAVSGTVYRLAVGSLGVTSYNLGVIREGDHFAAQTVTVYNTAQSSDAFSDDLAAAVGTTTGGVTGRGAVTRLTAGGSGDTGIQLEFGSVTFKAGTYVATANVDYTSKGQAGTGLLDAKPLVGGGSVTLSGTVYREGALALDGSLASVSTPVVDLGHVRVGGTLSDGTLRLGNGAAADNLSDRLDVRVTKEGLLQLDGGSYRFEAGSSALLTVHYLGTTEQAGLKIGTLSLATTSVALPGVALADVAQGTRTVLVQGQVYNGQGVWTGTSGGSWMDWNKWSAAGGRPGVDGAVSVRADTALLAGGSQAQVIQLPGQTLDLVSLSFTGTGGVTLSGTVGAAVSLDNGGVANLSVSASGGQHVLDAPLLLAGSTTFTVDTGARLTITGLVSGGALDLVKEGAGLLYFAQGYNVGGLAFVNAGSLALGQPVIGPGKITLNDAATLVFYINQDVSLPNNEISGGNVLALDPSGNLSPYSVEWKGGSTVVRLLAGATLDLGTLKSGAKIEILSGGTLLLNDGQTLTKNNRLVAGNTLTLSVSGMSALELSGTISDGTLGAGRVLKSDAGFLALAGSNSYTGGTEVAAGTLELRHSLAAGTGAIAVGGGGMLSLNADTAAGGLLKIENLISGSGHLVKAGTGLVTIGTAAAVNTYTGGTTVAAGTLAFSVNGALGSGAVSVGSSGALLVTPAADAVVTVHNALSGGGELVKGGGGTLVVGAENTLGKGTRLESGVLVVNAAGGLGGAVALNGGQLSLANAMNVAVPVSVSGDVVVSVAARSELSRQLNGADGATLTGTGAGELAVGGTVVVGGGVFTVHNAVVGAGGVVKSGAGELVWGGNGQSQAAALHVAAGTLTVTGNQTFNGLSKAGVGVLKLTGDKARVSGDAVLQAGTLMLVGGNAALSNVSTLVVGTGNAGRDTTLLIEAGTGTLVLGGSTVAQTLKGRGTIVGNVTVGANAKVAPGNSVDTETVKGNLILQGIYEAEFNAVTAGGNGGSSDLLEVIAGVSGGGVATINGALVVPKSMTHLADFHREQVYAILTAKDGVSGEFAGIRAGAAWKARLQYVDTNGVVQYQQYWDARGAVHYLDAVGKELGGTPNKGGAAPLTNKVQMVVERMAFAEIGSTGSRREVGRGVDLISRALNGQPLSLSPAALGAAAAMASAPAAAAPQLDPVLVALVETLYGLDQAGLDQLLDQLMPRAFAEMYTLSLNRLQDVQKTVSDRLNILGAAQTSGGGHEVLSLATGLSGEWNAWTNAYGSYRARSANPAAGEGGSSVSSFGDVTGVEKRVGRATFGLFGAVGTSNTQINLPSSSVKSDSWHVGTYMSLPLGTRMFLDVLGVYGEAQSIVRQTQVLPGGTFQSRALALSEEMLLQVGLGGQLAPSGSKWTVVPSVRFAYAAMHFEKATMEGAGALGILSEAKWQGTTLSRTGLEIGREGRVGRVPVRVSGSAAWVHDFAPNPREMQVSWQGLESAGWSVSGMKRPADTVRVGGAVEIGVGERRTLRLYGEQEFVRGNNVFRGGINFTIGF